MRFFRTILLASLLGGGLIGGCRGVTPGTIDPVSQDPCPAGVPHLAVGVPSTSSPFSDDPTEQALFRFTQSLTSCRGLILPRSRYGNLETVAGLPDGSDLVGFDGNSVTDISNALIRFRGEVEIDRVEDLSQVPMIVAAVTFGGAPAVAILWGRDDRGSLSADRIDVVNAGALASVLGTYTPPRDLLGVAAALSDGDDEDKMSGLIEWDGLQELRADPGSETLATTGEIQVALSSGGTTRALDVHGGFAQISTDEGVSFWRTGLTPGFVGPRYCRHAAFVGDPLPTESADYVDVAIDPSDPANAALVVVRGSLNTEDSGSTHVFRLQHRGECEWIMSTRGESQIRSLAWSGRP